MAYGTSSWETRISDNSKVWDLLQKRRSKTVISSHMYGLLDERVKVSVSVCITQGWHCILTRCCGCVGPP